MHHSRQLEGSKASLLQKSPAQSLVLQLMKERRTYSPTTQEEEEEEPSDYLMAYVSCPPC